MTQSSVSPQSHSATIGFYGGVGSVTGANFLVDTRESKILLDCGLIQGEKAHGAYAGPFEIFRERSVRQYGILPQGSSRAFVSEAEQKIRRADSSCKEGKYPKGVQRRYGDRFARAENAKPFGYDPREIDALIVSHAHADHIGRIPKLVRDGFNGSIYSTPPTKDLAAIMLKDALKIMTLEVRERGEPLLYEEGDIARAFGLWNTVSYCERVPLPDGVSFALRNAGHILGSAFVELSRDRHTIVYSGDIGNVPQPLLDPPDIPTGYQYLIMESVYGDRLHEDAEERSHLLLQYIENTISRKGTLIIPAFSLERTQTMLFEINNFVEQKLIPPIPVFLDSPLAIAVTDIYRTHRNYLRKEIREQIEKGDDIFDFPKLSFTKTVAASHEIASVLGPKIIIAGSGMSHGGRIRDHEKHYLGDPNTTLLLVGYQTVGSIGRLLQDGAKRVRIDGIEIPVKARVATIEGYSGHTDRDGLINFVAEGGDEIEQVFVTMGEEKASLFLVQRLRDYLGLNAVAPEAGSRITIQF